MQSLTQRREGAENRREKQKQEKHFLLLLFFAILCATAPLRQACSLVCAGG
jgi:hypothetical protein